jgi:hypothetical protein
MILLLASQMAVGMTEPSWQEEYLAEIVEAHGSTSGTAVARAKECVPLEALLKEIDNLRQGSTEGEHAPTQAAIRAMVELLQLIRPLVNESDVPIAELDFYYGELAVEWRNGDRILRLTSFSGPNKTPRIDYGTLGDSTPGEYHTDIPATPEDIATRLAWLASGENAE